MRSRIRVITAIGLAAIAAVVASAVAEAKTFKAGPVRYVIKSTSVASGGGAFKDGYCPGSSRAIGGGGAIAGPLGDVHQADLYPLDIFDMNVDPDNGFRAGAFNETGSSKKLKVALTCLTPSAGAAQLNYHTSATAVGAGNASTFASASCASGNVLGGGAQLPLGDYDGEELDSTHPTSFEGGNAKPDDGWSGRVRTNNGPGQVTGYAICAPKSAIKRTYRAKSKVIFGGLTKRIVVKCPRGPAWRVSSGGVQGITLDVLRSLPWDGKDKGKAPDDGWVVKAGPPSPFADPAGAVAHAICIKKT